MPSLVSEDFTNVSTRANVAFDGSSTSGSGGAIDATIIYDSANESYTLTTPTGTLTFSSADIDPDQSGAGVAVYVKTNGNRTDTLTLTQPGTSGSLTYRYVGGAFWQTTVANSSSDVHGSLDAIVYGVETVPGDAPTSGSANYDVDLIAARSTEYEVYQLGGEGAVSVDFASGKLLVVGTLTLNASLFGNAAFHGAATLASEGEFSGTLVIDDGYVFSGLLNGRFFGPDAAEIGAAFYLEGPLGMVASGALLGRQGTPDTANTSFIAAGPAGQLEHSETFTALQASLDFDFDGILFDGNQLDKFEDLATGIGSVRIRYDVERDTYLLVEDPAVFPYPLRYSAADDLMVGVAAEDTAAWPQVGSDGTYVRAWRLDTHFAPDDPDTRRDYGYRYQVFGMPTLNEDLVRTGAASYDIGVDGVAADAAFANPVHFFGEGTLSVAFDSGEVLGVAPLAYEVLQNPLIPPQTGTGSWSFEGTLSSTANAFEGSVAITGFGAYNDGTGNGAFFGPSGEEVGGVFTAVNSAGGGGLATGAFFSRLLPVGMEVELTTDTTFASFGSDTVVGQPPAGREWGAGTKVSYFVTSDEIRVELANGAVIDFSNTLAQGYPFGQDQTVLIEPGPGNYVKHRLSIAGAGVDGVDLSYLRVGAYTSGDAANAGDILHSTFYFGLPTVDMPVLGSASYATAVDATGTVDGTLYYLTESSANFSVDFAGGTVSTLLHLAGAPALGGTSADLGQFTGSGTVSQAAFEGTFGGADGGFWGSFFGPEAAEMGYYFRLAQDNITAQGSVLGRKD